MHGLLTVGIVAYPDADYDFPLLTCGFYLFPLDICGILICDIYT